MWYNRLRLQATGKNFSTYRDKTLFSSLNSGRESPAPCPARGVPPTMSRRGIKAPTGLNKAVSRPRLARSATYQKRVVLPHTERNERGGDEPR